jgi:hypothetical protein
MAKSDWLASLSSVSDVAYLKIQRSGLGIRAASYKPVEPKAPVTKGDRNWESALKSSSHGQSKTVRKGNLMTTFTKKSAQEFKTQSPTNTASVEAVITKVCGCEAYKDVFTYGRWAAQGKSPKKDVTAHSISTLVEKEGQKPYWHTAKLFCKHQVQTTQEPKAPEKELSEADKKAAKAAKAKELKAAKAAAAKEKAAKAALAAAKPSAPTELDQQAFVKAVSEATAEAVGAAITAAFASATK